MSTEVCKRGHLRTPANTAPNGQCKDCVRMLVRDRRARSPRIPVRCPECLSVRHVQEQNRNDCDVASDGTLERLCLRCAALSRRRLSTHCANGHEWTPENTRLDRKGARICRECRRLKARERRANDPEYAERRRATVAAYHAKKRATDPEWVAKRAAQVRTRRDTINARRRERYATDAAHRERVLAHVQATHSRVLADPVRTEAYLERERFRQHGDRRRKGKPERNFRAPKSRSSLLPRGGTERYPTGPFVEWWRAYQAASPLLKTENFLAGAGADSAHVRRAVNGEVTRLALDLIDKVLVQAGEPPTTLLALYPWPADEENDIEASMDMPLLLPEPVPEPPKIRDAYYHPDKWEPPAGMFTPDHLERLMRWRGELKGETSRHAPGGTVINANAANVEREREWRAERKAA